MESIYKRCNNCGRPSHCGTSLWEEHRDSLSLRLYGEIKVCHSCHCGDCQGGHIGCQYRDLDLTSQQTT